MKLNNRTKRTGLWALVGLGASAAAYFGWRSLSPEKKQQVKDSVSDAGQTLKEKAQELENTVSNKLKKTKETAESKVENVA